MEGKSWLVEHSTGAVTGRKLVACLRIIGLRDTYASMQAAEAHDLASQCTEAIDNVHGTLHSKLQATKRATAKGIKDICAATSMSLADVYQATKASCSAA